MKKNYYLIGGILLSMLLTTPNVLASTSAFSVGSKYASTIDPTQSDFTQNVINAAQGYYPHSTLTASYYTNNPTYSYLNGTKVGGSRVFFINGHAGPTSIYTAAKDSTEYRTGLSLSSTNPYNEVSQKFNNKTFKLVGIGNRSFAATNIITFAGCKTNEGSNTITRKAYNNGAKVAIGFTNSITSRFYKGPDWLKKYNYSLGAGNSVSTAVKQAKITYPNEDLTSYVSIVGDGNTTIGTKNTHSLSLSLETVDESYNETKLINPDIDMETYNEVRMDINELFQLVSDKKIDNIDFKSLNNIVLEDLSKYKDIFKSVIDEISAFDNQFNINDYKVIYNLVNEEEGFGFLNFYYYIDGKIETNKVYSADINNYEITGINLAGVRKININKINNVNENELIEKINSFEQDKLQKINKATNLKLKNVKRSLKNNVINLENFNDDIEKVTEKYIYDYNDNTLKYNLSLTVGNHNTFSEIEGYEINL